MLLELLSLTSVASWTRVVDVNVLVATPEEGTAKLEDPPPPVDR